MRHFSLLRQIWVNNINREWSLSTCLWKKWPRGTGCPHCFVADGFWCCSPELLDTLPSFSVAWDGFFSCESAVLTRQVCSMHQAPPPPPQKKRDTFVTFICWKVSDWRSIIVKTYSQLGDVRENVRVADDSLQSWKTMRLRQPPKWHIGFQVPAILARWCRSSNCTWSVESEFTTPMSMESKVTLSFNLRFNISLHSILHSP